MTIFIHSKGKLIHLFTLMCLLSVISNKPVSGQTNITLDLSQKTTAKESVLGFLHINNVKALDKDIKLLKPKYWRLGNYLFDKDKRRETITALQDRGIIPILVLSDLCIYNTLDKNSTNFNRIEPFKDPRNYLAFIEKMYLENGDKVIYDIWNEPDTRFWSGNKEQFFQAFKMAHDKIRSLPGGQQATILGPGTSKFDMGYINDFLDFCKANSIKLDILAWHEGGVLDEVKDMENHIKYARQNWLTKYSTLNIKDIFIPEIMWDTEKFNPFAVITFAKAIENQGAKGACKTCWDLDAAHGGNTCFNNSIDGLLNPKGETRSVWWSYKLYAESLSSRIHSTADPSTIEFSYFSPNSRDTINVLFGSIKKNDSKVSILLKNTKQVSSFKSTIKTILYQIPNTDVQPLKKPIIISRKDYKNANTLQIDLSHIDQRSLYLIKIF